VACEDHAELNEGDGGSWGTGIFAGDHMLKKPPTTACAYAVRGKHMHAAARTARRNAFALRVADYEYWGNQTSAEIDTSAAPACENKQTNRKVGDRGLKALQPPAHC
jgi:hypothetical protein